MAAPTPPAGGNRFGRLVRHQLADRLFHWITAAAVLTLMASAFVPILGYKFDWVPLHWMTGLVLTIAVLFHIVRSTFWQSLAAIVPGPRDVVDSWRIFRHTVIDRSTVLRKQGKYSVAQKLIHSAVTVVVLVLVGTGLLMLAKIDTSFWQRNPYFLPQRTWGIIYVLHGYAAMSLITLVMIHIYFGLRPEKLYFTRAMILGWITRKEYDKTFDPARWAPEQEEEPSPASLEASERPTEA